MLNLNNENKKKHFFCRSKGFILLHKIESFLLLWLAELDDLKKGVKKSIKKMKMGKIMKKIENGLKHEKKE
jgi:hypothetical protein